ncbi:hypothetical protein MMC30_007235 [Trapelia coarctata]|nr:hypothetical protein [Trapelia coarctata]
MGWPSEAVSIFIKFYLAWFGFGARATDHGISDLDKEMDEPQIFAPFWVMLSAVHDTLHRQYLSWDKFAQMMLAHLLSSHYHLSWLSSSSLRSSSMLAPKQLLLFLNDLDLRRLYQPKALMEFSKENSLEWLRALLALALVVLLAVKTVQITLHLFKKLRYNHASTKGCQMSIQVPNHLPFGLDRLFGIFQADQNNHLLLHFWAILDEFGYTLRTCIIFHTLHATVDPRNLEAILSTHFADYSFDLRRKVFFPLLGDGIFTQDGEPWKHSRAMLRPQFFHGQYEDLAIFEQHTNSLIACIEAAGPIVDLQPFFFRFTMDTTTHFLFGQAVDGLEPSSDGEEAFAGAFNIAQDYLARRIRLGNLYWLSGTRALRKSSKVVHDHVDAIIKRAMDEATPDDESKNSRYVFLEHLIKETKDKKALRDQLVNILIAGRDTTACLLSWTFRLLVRHPWVLARLQNEIFATIGSSGTPSRQDIKRMTYLANVLKETLRLYPSVPINQRTAVRTTTLPFGGGPDGSAPVIVRPGESVGWSPYVMQRRKDIYGPNADDFRPERWEEESLASNRALKWAYLPFNGGPRVCLGIASFASPEEFALLEAAYAVARIVQKFPQIGLPDDEVVVKTGMEEQLVTLVLYCPDGCRVKIG